MKFKLVLFLPLLFSPFSAVGQAPTRDATHFTGRDASAKIQAAIDDLPPTGGLVDARGLNDLAESSGSTSIDPKSKSITLPFGPYTYHIKQIIVRSNLRISGVGEGLSTPDGPATILLADCSTCDGTAAISLPESRPPVQVVVLWGFR